MLMEVFLLGQYVTESIYILVTILSINIHTFFIWHLLITSMIIFESSKNIIGKEPEGV